ncbi:golgin subfamily A member 6-like protein 4 [Papaver somniferum]|uniref:golgin subfamily A member 6-like protein 4 n=1 Tax=Papaver somniferum TaxID=3469 RepID=UPI000E706001|nr:golgin subfamily A member 6-like protein 4 [Papaver somniferum]
MARRSKRLDALKGGEKKEASEEDERQKVIRQRKGNPNVEDESMKEHGAVTEKKTNREKVGKNDGGKDVILKEPSKTLRREKRKAGMARRDDQAKRGEYERNGKTEVGITHGENTNSETITVSSRKRTLYREENPYKDYEEEDERGLQKRRLLEGHNQERYLRRMLVEARYENHRLKYDDERRCEDENKRKGRERDIDESTRGIMDLEILHELRRLRTQMGNSHKQDRSQWMEEKVKLTTMIRVGMQTVPGGELKKIDIKKEKSLQKDQKP